VTGATGVRSVKRTAMRTAARVIYGSGAARMLGRIGGRRRAGSLHILVYHRVNDERDPFFPGVPVDAFTRQMKFIARHFTVRPLEAAVSAMGRDETSEGAVAVTFDDGYMDNFTNAFPILRRLAIPATMFLATDVVGTGRILWHDRVFRAFRETAVPELTTFGPLKRHPLSTIEEKLLAQSAVLAFLRHQDDRTRSEWISRLAARLRVEDLMAAPGLMLGWEEVKAMQGGGVSFGSHSMTHPILSRVPVERAREEIFGSKLCIEQHLRVRIRAFAYPNGRPEDFDTGTKRLLRDAGYTCAVTTTAGVNGAGQDPFELRRGQPWDEDLATFAVKFHLSRLGVG
jgi:peptidoglycan/xylan/chitin deacetylase (PgdA/CDA1 family)